MNILQEHGIISDNAITIDGVGNYARAMIWLHERHMGKGAAHPSPAQSGGQP